MNGSSDFFINLFGTIAGPFFGRLDSNVDFIPTGSNGETLTLRGQDATWLGLRMPMQQKWAYDYCYPLASVIDRMAESDITGEVEILRAEGKGKENEATSQWAKDMRRLLLNPNPLQSWEQFRAQQVVYKKIFGYCPVMPIKRAGFENSPELSSAMINLPPWLFRCVPTGKYLYQSKIEEFVKEYSVSIMGQTIQLPPDAIFILEDSFIQSVDTDFLLPQSRLVGLDMAISNLCAAMEADNVLLRKKGPLGFISHDTGTKDNVAGYVPMDELEKAELQADLSKYGMSWGQYQYVISKTATRWNPMSFDVKGLGTKETIVAAARAVCQRYGFPYVLFEDSDATYSNQESAHKKLYDNNVIPNNYRDMAKYNQFFKASENNCKICTDYSHLAVFQEDELNLSQARFAKDQALQVEWNSNLITRNQWLTILGMEPLGIEGDLTLSQLTEVKQGGDSSGASPDTLKAQAALRGSVGGVQGILAVQTAVGAGTTTMDSALSILTLVYGYSDQEAKELLGQPAEVAPPPITF